jgi:hypothetical protein
VTKPNAREYGSIGDKVELPPKLTQAVFIGQPESVVVACVDYDGLLKFGDCADIRYTWASERWRGANWINQTEGTPYKPLTMLVREGAMP